MKPKETNFIDPNEVAEQVSEHMEHQFLQTGWFYLIVGVGVLFGSLYLFSNWTDIPRQQSELSENQLLKEEIETLESRVDTLESKIQTMETLIDEKD